MHEPRVLLHIGSGQAADAARRVQPCGDVRLYPRVCLNARYEPYDRFRLGEKTLVKENLSKGGGAPLTRSAPSGWGGGHANRSVEVDADQMKIVNVPIICLHTAENRETVSHQHISSL
jgi:hypothetical protein